MEELKSGRRMNHDQTINRPQANCVLPKRNERNAMEQVLKIDDVMELLCLSRPSIEKRVRLARQGKSNFPLPFTQKGQKIRWTESAFKRWFEQEDVANEQATPKYRAHKAHKVRKQDHADRVLRHTKKERRSAPVATTPVAPVAPINNGGFDDEEF
jgi:predicted DNA-binding transcriptional regulator AlpA